MTTAAPTTVPPTTLCPLACEDLTTFTEVDSDDSITVSEDRVTFDTIQTLAVSYVVKDYGVDYFGEYAIDFEVYIDSAATSSVVGIMGVSNTYGTYQDMVDANDGITIRFYESGAGAAALRIEDESNDAYDDYIVAATSTLGPFWCTFTRQGTTAKLLIYDDAARTSLVDTLSITCETDEKRYLYALHSRDGGGSQSITGYTQCFNILFADCFPADWEDLTTYDDTDSGGDLTITDEAIVFDTIQRVANSKVNDVKGANYFTDYLIQFDAEITDSDTDGHVLVQGVSNTSAATVEDLLIANTGIWVDIYNDAGNLTIRLYSGYEDNSDTYVVGGTTMSRKYFDFVRVGTVAYLYIYSDVCRTTLLDVLQINTNATKWSYHIAFGSRDASGTATISGDTRYHYIVETTNYTLPPTTAPPSTTAPTTGVPTTAGPTTTPPTTLAPTTAAPTTLAPTTLAATTSAPTTVYPTTEVPTTGPPSTGPATTPVSTTAAPTTSAPTTLAPTTSAPTTAAPTTQAPTTVAPTTSAPTTAAPTTVAPTTSAPTTSAPTTQVPTTVAPTTVAPTTVAPTTLAPTTVAPTTVYPTTLGPTTVPPTTVAPTTLVPTTEPPFICTHSEYSLIVTEITLDSIIC